MRVAMALVKPQPVAVGVKRHSLDKRNRQSVEADAQLLGFQQNQIVGKGQLGQPEIFAGNVAPMFAGDFPVPPKVTEPEILLGVKPEQSFGPTDFRRPGMRLKPAGAFGFGHQRHVPDFQHILLQAEKKPVARMKRHFHIAGITGINRAGQHPFARDFPLARPRCKPAEVIQKTVARQDEVGSQLQGVRAGGFFKPFAG